MKELDEQVQTQDEDQSLDQTLNIGSEIILAAPTEAFPQGIRKRVKIGTIGLLREVRGKASGAQGMRFVYAIGRPKAEARTIDGQEFPEMDFPAIEAAYREMFDMILVEGLTDHEYEATDEKGIEELDKALDRFL